MSSNLITVFSTAVVTWKLGKFVLLPLLCNGCADIHAAIGQKFAKFVRKVALR